MLLALNLSVRSAISCGEYKLGVMTSVWTTSVLSPHGHSGVLRWEIASGAAWESSLKSFVRILCCLAGHIIVHEGFLSYIVVAGVHMKS